MNSSLGEKIQVVDNFLSNQDFQTIVCELKQARWGFQSSDNTKSTNEFLLYDVSEKKYFNEELNKKIQKYFSLDCKCDRIYFNGQWPGRDGDFHVDPSLKTFLIYISNYNISWGGFTHFFEPPDHEYMVSPKTNRGVLFPGSLFHKAYSFSNQNCPMRISLAYKFV